MREILLIRVLIPLMPTLPLLMLIPLPGLLKLSPSASVLKGAAYSDFKVESKTHL